MIALNVRKGLSKIHWRQTIGGIAWVPTEGAGVGFIDTKKNLRQLRGSSLLWFVLDLTFLKY
jgi:hypothetical protein